jgi:hypothetical protein
MQAHHQMQTQKRCSHNSNAGATADAVNCNQNSEEGIKANAVIAATLQ